MQEIDGEFIVKAGSLSQGEWISKSVSHSTGYAKLHADLRVEGKLISAPDGLCQFAVDVAFKSPVPLLLWCGICKWASRMAN